MFTYNKLSIDSSIPYEDIMDYFMSIGAIPSSDDTYLFPALEVKVISQNQRNMGKLNIPRTEIIILSGERDLAEKFLTNFRLRFLSAGG